MDRGAWRATARRVTKSQTRLKQLSMFQWRGVWVWSLLGKLRTHMPCGQIPPPKTQTNKQTKTWKHNIVTKSIQTWKMVHIKKKKKVVESALNPDWLIQSSSFPLNHVSWLWFPKMQQLSSLAPSSCLAFFVLLWHVFSCPGKGLLHSEFLLYAPRVVALGHHHPNTVIEEFAPKVYSKAGEEMSGKKARVWRSFAFA